VLTRLFGCVANRRMYPNAVVPVSYCLTWTDVIIYGVYEVMYKYSK
jgi:hypothetical protein